MKSERLPADCKSAGAAGKAEQMLELFDDWSFGNPAVIAVEFVEFV